MLKFSDSEVVFREFPDEVSLCINITNCPFKCPGCHSPELQEDIGIFLSRDKLTELINKNEGITCVGFMGGDSDPLSVTHLAQYVKDEFPDLKVGWYSGRDKLPKEIDLKYFDYIKLGPYIESLGGLNMRTTNQNMFKVVDIGYTYSLKNITQSFWKNVQCTNSD